MATLRKQINCLWGKLSLAAHAGLVLAIAFALLIPAVPLRAQTYSVIYSFLGGTDGAEPNYGLAIDPNGRLWGTTFEDRTPNGNVYELLNSGSGWDLIPVHFFNGITDQSGGFAPYATVTFGPGGNLYGTTGYGGIANPACGSYGVTGCGVIYQLTKTGIQWFETVLYSFCSQSGCSDGAEPYGGAVIFDNAGNLYGTTYAGGSSNCGGGCGVVYELSPSSGSWTETVLYRFTGGTDGYAPWSGLTMDAHGNLYGTTYRGGTYGFGTVYQIVCGQSGCQKNILYNFRQQDDGGGPYAGVIFDSAGNLYGATQFGGSMNGGTAFELSPNGSGWTLQTLHPFNNPSGGQICAGPQANLTLDSAGNLYGTTACDGPDPQHHQGTVFKLTHESGGWTYTPFHDFTGGSDGGVPHSNVVFDSSGNLYGTASEGGLSQTNGQYCDKYCGVIFEVTPN
jgi:uncharacterized repeat protein (TIGR03803 family)